MINIKINNKKFKANPGSRIIEVADQLKIPIPRFCYHEKLSIVASCRMCLVEVVDNPKLLPACSTYIAEGMEILTASAKTIASQRDVMEFLLINHPLDCPICEQAGECELQDLSVEYGGDKSRYYGTKRSVVDENLGPLITSNMNRCIHCTRCVRFGEEVAGHKELGVMYKGDKTLIATFNQQGINSELSGNMVDLCPVGALNAKPFVSGERSWVLQQKFGVGIHDCAGSNIHYHIAKDKINRVVPYYNPEINNTWLADRDRFGFLGINSQDRLKYPLLKCEGKWCTISWKEALTLIAKQVLDLIDKYGAEQIGALISPNTTTEECLLLYKLFNSLGCNNIDYRLRQLDFRNQEILPQYAIIDLEHITDITKQKLILLIGSYVNKEQPIIGLHIRAATLQQAEVVVINPIDFEFNFTVVAKYIPENANLLLPLLKLTKAIVDLKKINNLPAMMKKLLNTVDCQPADKNIAKKITTLKEGEGVIILGALAIHHPEYSNLNLISNFICSVTNLKFGCLYTGANTQGAWLSRKMISNSKQQSLNAKEMLENNLKAYFLIGVEPELDSSLGLQVRESFLKANLVVAITAFESNLLLKYANLLLPMAVPQESGGSYINATGMLQTFDPIVKSSAEIKPLINIFMELAECFNLDISDFNLPEILQNVKQAKELVKPTNFNIQDCFTGQLSMAISNCELEAGLIFVPTISLYAVDAIVRRSVCLQQTKDAKIMITINPIDAKKLNIAFSENVTMKTSANLANHVNRFSFKLNINERVPKGCIWVNQVNNKTLLGIPYSKLVIEKTQVKVHD